MIIHLQPRCPRIWLLTRFPPSHANPLAFKSSSAILQCPQYSISAASRPFLQVDDRVLKRPTCWTILTSSSGKAYDLQPSRQHDIYRNIRPGHVPLVLLLVTPAHIKLLNDNVGFIPYIIERYLKPELHQEVDVLAAVVDRVPFPPASIAVGDGELDPKAFSRQQCPEGSEGVSVALLNSTQLAPNVWDKKLDSSKPESNLLGAQKTSKLSFSFSRLDGKSHTIHMPLANTIFQNNKLSTLFIRRYIRSDMATKSSGMEPTRERSLDHQTVMMNDASSPDHVVFRNSISSRLIPITPPRNVAAAVGNIIRQIFDQSDRLSPASHELESTINSAIGDGRLDRGLVEVWALLRPQGDEMTPRKVEASFDFEAELTRGARLLKVLSGGGGWGEKQGLLALDPDIPGLETSYKNRESDQEYTPQAKLFEDIVRTTDTVTFLVNNFVNSSDTDASSNLSLPVDTMSRATLRDAVAEFGSIPSTIDDVPGPLDATQPASALNHVLIKNYFGMLSEHGMSMTMSDTPQNPERGLSKTEPTVTPDHATKLDAPYIVLSMHSETGYSEQNHDAEALPSESDSTDNNAANDKSHEASDGTLQQVEATYRAQKVARTSFTSPSAYRPEHKGVQAIQKTSQHSKAPAAHYDGRKGVRYTLSDSDEVSKSKQVFKQTRNADGGFQLTKYLASPRSERAKGVEEALRTHRESSRPRDKEAFQNLYKEQLAQGATTAEALTLIERMKGNNGAPGEASSKISDMPELRTSKYASLSKTGKAMERHERGQSTSTKFAPRLPPGVG